MSPKTAVLPAIAVFTAPPSAAGIGTGEIAVVVPGFTALTAASVKVNGSFAS